MDSVHEIFWRLHRNEVDPSGHPMFPGVADLLGEVDALRRQLSETVEVLNWIVHLHHDVGKSGNVPQDDEWYDALASAERILNGDDYKEEKNCQRLEFEEVTNESS